MELTYKTRAAIKIEKGYRVDSGILCRCSHCGQSHYRQAPKDEPKVEKVQSK